jgi:thymidylate synthase (FAD)
MRAQWEIRKMAVEMLRILREKHPFLFNHVGPNCYYLGYCTEGKKSCGRAEEVKRFFATLGREEA